jgi:hypothetical protein
MDSLNAASRPLSYAWFLLWVSFEEGDDIVELLDDEPEDLSIRVAGNRRIIRQKVLAQSGRYLI